MTTPSVVIDTNWVLDLFVFHDPRASDLRHALESGQLQWLVCAPMREELARVLTYPAVSKHLSTERDTPSVLQAFDRLARPVAQPAACPMRCKDPDDQVFIDLAYAHQCTLVSKDTAVLRLHKRLASAGTWVTAAWPALPSPK